MLPARVLIVDDDPLYARRARMLLSGSYDVRIAQSRAEAIRDVTIACPDVVVLDMFLHDTDAFHLLDDLRAHLKPDPVNVMFLAKGPGADTRYCTDQDTFFGVVTRESGPEGLRDALRAAVQSTRSSSQAHAW